MKLQIGENIRSLRKEKGITQEKLAELLGVTSQSVSRWESGAGYPDMDQLPGLASLFEVSMDTLLGYDGTVEKQNRLVLELSAMISRGEREEGIRRARETLGIYPANTALAMMLATFLFSSTEASTEELEEVVSLCRRAASDTVGSNPEKILMTLAAKNLMIPSLVRLNRREEAGKEAGLLPGVTMTREYLMPLVLSGADKQKYLLDNLPLWLITINNVYLNGYAHSEPFPAETGAPAALAMGVKKYTLEECLRDLMVWDAVYAGLPPEADAERELDSVEIYLALHKRAAVLLAERGQYEKALEHLERSVRGTLRPAAEKRFHAFNERIRQFGESIEKDCCVAFENVPAEIKQQFHKIMDPITG